MREMGSIYDEDPLKLDPGMSRSLDASGALRMESVGARRLWE